MYLWSINGLKRSLIEKPLSENTAFLYLLLSVFFTSLFIVIDIDNESKNIWDIFDDFVAVGVTVLGTIYIYLKNGGVNGSYFLQRYFSIGWVITLRLTLMCFLPLIFIAFMIQVLFGDISEGTTWYQSILIVALGIFLYWRIGFHISQVAQNTTFQTEIQ